ncbi:MAG: MBL fold metallo-hydrolase [Actinomycetota bacterium]
MELIVLGSCGTWPGAGRAASGYVVRHDGHALWLDVGTGTLAALQRHTALAEVDAVLVSHEHVDHCIDLLPTYYAIAYGNLRPPGMPLYAPVGLTDRLRGAVGADYHEPLARSFDVTTVADGAAHDIGPFRVTFLAMPHVGLPAFGFRVEAGGRTIAYTGDTGPGPEAIALARGADLFLAEAALQAGDAPFAWHLTAGQAGAAAAEAAAARLVLTHIRPDRDPAISVREAGTAYDGPIEVALEDRVFVV